MKKVKAILHTFRVSIVPNHLFYPKLMHIRTSYSLTYFIFCIICLSCLFTVGVYIRVKPDKVTFYHNAIIKTLNTYPDSAELILTNGQLQSTHSEPIFLWMNKMNGTRMLLLGINQHSLMQQSDSPESLIFLGEKQLRFLYKDMSAFFNYPTEGYIINKQTVTLFTEAIDQCLTRAQGFFYVILFSLFPLIVILTLCEATLATSIVLYLVFHLFTKRVHIRKCIQVGFHASILPFIIGSALFYSFPSVHGTLTITGALIFIFQLVGIYEAYFSESSEKPALALHHHASGR